MKASTSQRIAVLGAGTMGAGIAQVCALSGHSTTLYDSVADSLARARDGIKESLHAAISKGKCSEEEAEGAQERVDIRTDLEAALDGAHWIIEAIVEDLEAKKELVARCGRLAPQALFASNTSSLPLSAIAAAHAKPEQVLGLHFFNPVPVMKLLELVRAEQSSDATVEAGLLLGQSLNKECIVVADSPGFASSRLGLVLGLEAMRMLESGVASAEDIDKAMVLGYRHPMGPLRLTDLVGLDVRLAIAEHLHRELGESFRPPPILRRMVRAGQLGQKSGQGFYPWG